MGATVTTVTFAAPAAQAWPGAPYLSYGDTGEGVACVQWLLDWWHYDTTGGKYYLDQDGIWGPATDAAVRSFQDAEFGTDDGIVGPQTGAALWAVPRKSGSMSGSDCYFDIPT
ncbi:peptidoglycan-binding protein [Catenulispora sp. GAS73]|uniref:peptidoglycan-binding domain-containing protein n=1 Tax=Catenulispora sp. GAS73 TaxID=3156269 RepID=UPI0035159F4F